MRAGDKRALNEYLKKLEHLRSGGNVNPFEKKEEQTARIERAKKDYKYFVETYLSSDIATAETPYFHIRAAKRVLKDQNLRGLIRWGRSLAKSVVFNINTRLWLYINGIPVYFVLVGQSEDKAKQLLHDIQLQFEGNQLLIHDFGEQKVVGNWEKGFFQTKSGFIGQALGAGQSVRGLRVGGRRPTDINVDDLDDRFTIKNPKRQRELATWIESALIPTMDIGRRSFSMTNNYFAPLTVQEILRQRHPNWWLDQVNAYDPITFEPAWKEKYNKKYYRDIHNDGSLSAMAEYNNQPHIEGTIFTDDQIQFADLPRLDSFDVITGVWDVAYSGSTTSDYNAVRLMGLRKGHYWHIKTFCRQTKMANPIKWMYEMEDLLNKTNTSKELKKKIVIHWRFESQFWNEALKQVIEQVAREKGRRLNLVKSERPTTKKYDRIICLQPYYQNGLIYYSDEEKGSNDMQVAIAQLKGIEPGYKSHDDAPDAEAMGIQYLSRFRQKERSKPVVGKPPRPKSLY